ncbi:UDP-N-acetylmuramate dehydrogenase [Sulfurimonas paralvinellae]|uniref:UDP-N-acetylenolpyruvoylglucosamine reductase n=1 Tax=Sulfurimonas paralvinellae TaxID=317658 RepID=A0A7M1B542_9BACT|nr:UDP-N-acetylmuramate dehydrogenase [Sulfurimonas paralvinellae]QOP44857.1 UDP-N-acetylmuramate dehydrogenase [Sulfurimonas paralvinellae]
MNTKSINFSNYSSFKIGGTFDVHLLDAHAELDNLNDYYLIGSCNNILIGNNPPTLMMLSKEFDYIKKEDNLLKIGAATPSGKIASYCKKNNIANFEFLSHLPGKLGGLVFMNAGLKEYEIFNHLLSITTLNGEKKRDEIQYGYRFTNIDEPILEAVFELSYGYDTQKVAMFKKMRSNQPSTPSAGSCFKNPDGDYAGRLIEAVGLKGKMQGAMCFSQEHANFLVNTGGGKFEDAATLIYEAQKKVYEKFGILLELEIVVLDRDFQAFKPE